MAFWKEAGLLIVGGVISLGTVAATSYSDFFTKDREMDIKMLQIALDILREDPKESKIKAARGWAVDVINSSSEVQITGNAREELINNNVGFTFGVRGRYRPTLDELLQLQIGGIDTDPSSGSKGTVAPLR